MADEPLHEPASDITLDATPAGPVEPPSRSNADQPATPPIEQLHLWHMFLWTTCCAVVLGYLRQQIMFHRENQDMPAEAAFILFPVVALAGSSLTGLILTIPRLRRCPTLEPGHYLLAAQGVGYLLAALVFFILEQIHPHYREEAFLMFLPFMGAAIVTGISFFSSRMERRWRYLLTAIALYMGVGVTTVWILIVDHPIDPPPFLEWLLPCYFGIGSLIFLTLIGIALRDRFKKVPHGWLHRVGVLATSFWGLLPLTGLILTAWRWL